jgi:Zinc finger, C2H2 type
MLYKCKICEKEFKQKCHYMNHLNRLRPCEKLTKIIHENPLNLHVFPQKSENKCSYCYKIYSRSDVLKNHLLICKVKKQEIEEKESILNRLLEQNTLLVSTIDQQKEQINQLIKTNENLINQMKIKHTQNNKNVKNQNNGTINNINIVAFGKEDLSKIENKEFFEALTQMGYKIPAKMFEKIHINDKYPEYKNIYISDINRGKAMVHDGKKWKLDKYKNIGDKLLDKILNFMEERCEEIKDDKNITDKKKMNMENKLKILQIMKDYEKEEEKERHEYLRSQCKDHMKMDLYNNKEKIDDENPKAGNGENPIVGN